jgi:hypothetical protein
MKRLKRLTAVLAGSALLAAVAPVAAQAASYRHYVACGVTQNAKPSHLCQKPRKKGAFFRSNDATVFYTVCVKFPGNEKPQCADPEKARKGTLYVNTITSNSPGLHRVTWFVAGKQVGSFIFRVPS